MKTVNVYEAKAKLSQLLQWVQEGEDVIISKAGRPVARLIPFHQPSPRVAGRLQGQGVVSGEFFDPLPDDLQAFFC
ncbi:type II toxin-antitoxin system Phd/YefM family antitoxin [bacterium]|nr:type II toxin-antitoxin system Phd/YefM family antitoxin [bacterium]